MTTEKLAIRSLLTSDSIYLALLGSPGSLPYNTFYMHPTQTPSFPYVVFRLRPAEITASTGREILSKKYELIFDIFSQDGVYETIAARIIYLLHQIGNSNGYRTIFVGETNEEYSQELNAYSIQIKFDLFSRKEII